MNQQPRQESDEDVDIQAQLHPQLKQNPPYTHFTKHQAWHSFGHQRVDLLGVRYVVIVVFTMFCTELAAYLSDQLLLISALLHGFNLVLVMAIVLVEDIRISRRKDRCWHMLYWVCLHKYITALSNTNSRCMLYRDSTLQLSHSILLYIIYMHNTLNTKLSTAKYWLTVAVCLGFTIGKICYKVILKQRRWQLGSVWLLVGYCLSGLCYSRVLHHLINRTDGLIISQNNPLLRMWKWMKLSQYMPLLAHHHPNIVLYSRVLWLSISLVVTQCTIEQCRQHWAWMLIWLVCGIWGSGSQHSLKYLKNRHINILTALPITLVAQWLLTYHRTPQPSTLFIFHWTTLMSLLMVYQVINLEFHIHFPASRMPTIADMALINLSTSSPYASCHKDQLYKQSLITTKSTIRILLLAQSLLTYTAHSYVYYYNSSRQTHSGSSESRLYTSQYTDEYSIATKSAAGYSVLAIFVAIVSQLETRFSNQEANHQDISHGDTRLVIRGKWKYGLMVLSWLCLITNCRTSAAVAITNIIEMTPLSMVFGGDANVSLYYQLEYYLNSCQKDWVTPGILLTFVLSTTIFLTVTSSSQRHAHRSNTGKYSLNMGVLCNVLFWGSVVVLYLGIVCFAANWQCVEIGWFAAWLLAAVVLITTK